MCRTQSIILEILKKFRLEPSEMIQFFSNVVFANIMEEYPMSSKKPE